MPPPIRDETADGCEAPDLSPMCGVRWGGGFLGCCAQLECLTIYADKKFEVREIPVHFERTLPDEGVAQGVIDCLWMCVGSQRGGANSPEQPARRARPEQC